MRSLDLLILPIEERAGLARSNGRFSVSQPWTFIAFGAQELDPGWWMLDCEGDAAALEVRLSNASDPLIVFEGENARSLRIRVAEKTSFDVSLLVSPWPGDYAFRSLRLRRLSAAEEAGALAGAGVRLLGRDRPLKRIRNVLGRLASGQPVGVGAAGAGTHPSVRKSVVRPAHEAARRTQVQEEGGVFVHLLEGDELHRHAFRVVQGEFAVSPNIQAIYADSLEAGSVLPKPAWDAELAQHADYTGHPVFFREPVAPERRHERLAEAARANAVRRIALPLVKRAHTERRLQAPKSMPALDRWPRVSAIIPTKFRIDLLEKCLAGLAGKTDYPDLEAIVVDNGSIDARLPDVIRQASVRLAVKRIIDDRPFNYPQLNETGAANASGEILLLLNDDVEPIEVGWLKRMVASVIRPDVGAVGARLLYPDRTIQHAGVVLGPGGVCGHMWKGLTETEAAMMPEIVLPSSRLAVTAACLAVRRDVYEQAGGFDQSLRVALNDIDFCLKLHARGLRNIYRGDAVLIHHESQSRGADDVSVEKRRRLAEETGIFLSRWGALIDKDPYGSPAFNPAKQSGEVRASLLKAWDA